jgi:hypothetical protein
MDPEVGSAAVRAQLVERLQIPLPESLAPWKLLQWALAWTRTAATVGPLVAIAEFDDGRMMAQIERQGLVDDAEAQVTLHLDTAVDAWGNPVPNLLMPARINPPGVDFRFGEDDAPQGWRDLMSSLGYQLEAGSGTHWRCSDQPLNQPSDARCWIVAKAVPVASSSSPRAVPVASSSSQ